MDTACFGKRILKGSERSKVFLALKGTAFVKDFIEFRSV